MMAKTLRFGTMSRLVNCVICGDLVSVRDCEYVGVVGGLESYMCFGCMAHGLDEPDLSGSVRL